MIKIEKQNSSSGIGLLGGVFLIFLAGKLFGFLQWSWWWISSPLWLPLALLIVILFFVVAINGIRKAANHK